MLCEQEVVSDCLINFSVFSQTFLCVFSQTCTSYRNTALSSCSSLPFLEYLSYPIIEFTVTLEHIVGAHLFVSQVSLKRNIWQLMEKLNRIVFFNIKGTKTL